MKLGALAFDLSRGYLGYPYVHIFVDIDSPNQFLLLYLHRPHGVILTNCTNGTDSSSEGGSRHELVRLSDETEANGLKSDLIIWVIMKIGRVSMVNYEN